MSVKTLSVETMACSTRLIIFWVIIGCVWGCELTFDNTTVTLVGAKDVKTVSGCFSLTDDFVRVSYIQIINENVPVLRRDAISGLPNVIDIIIDSSNVTELEGGCFWDLPKLYLIKLRHNNFSTVREGVFNKLNIKELCLTNNSIETIHPRAFNDMPNLTMLQLDQNRIGYWSGEWFVDSPKINVLNFEYNLISNFPTSALQHVNGVHYDSQVNLNISTHVHLNNNRIRYLSDGAFNGIEAFGWLFLHRNEIEEISESSLGSLRSVEWVRLEHNQLRCIPRKLVNISPKVLFYMSNNPFTDECKNWSEALKKNLSGENELI
ncbi:leucine-rich repeat-containing protein 15-like [Euwallacea fornicatus]|uniref:leucine-rich repeat-containing protein 15-like n=1 Tax=Euwallacea fornicatus TaxID=995702 RepID=UPI00338F3B47